MFINLGLLTTLHYLWQLGNYDPKEKEKGVDLVKIKFHLNENIQWQCIHMQLEFMSSNLLKVLIWIELNYSHSLVELNSNTLLKN